MHNVKEKSFDLYAILKLVTTFYIYIVRDEMGKG